VVVTLADRPFFFPFICAETVECFNEAINIHIDNNQFASAAKLEQVCTMP
jgi:hypothetical protein